MTKHRTADGRVLFISQMTDEHLKATLEMHRNNANNYRNIATKTDYTFESSALYTHNNKDLAKSAKIKYKALYEALGHYVLEAVIRGIDIKELVQEIANRKERDQTLDVIDQFQLPRNLKGIEPSLNNELREIQKTYDIEEHY